ncbi:MAG TPA: methyltransferase domain-containing protein [Terriglobales bacterium]|jgi:SAM-dependent methyltransferase|nr:methyltransferase domain-containing protein [Terriglobales bacterium]
MEEAQILAELRAQVAAIKGAAARQPGLRTNDTSTALSQQPLSLSSPVDRGAIQDALSEVRVSEAAFAYVNPRNPGLLNAFAQNIKKTIGRALSWYTRSLQVFHAGVARALEVQGQAIVSAADQLSSRVSSGEAQVVQLGDQQLSTQNKVSSVHADVTSLRSDLMSLQNEVALFKGSVPSTIDERFRTLHQQLQQARDVAGVAVRDQRSPYVPYFKDMSPVVDLGCGRGEFLELLKEAGIDAYGVDSDPVACEEARAKALKVIEADLFTYLRGLPERCLGGVFSSRVAEYLPTNSLAEMISLCSHKMKPGGVIVVETTAPASDSLFGRNYHSDASHYHPVYPDVLKAMVDSNGFVNSAILIVALKVVLSADSTGKAPASPDDAYFGAPQRLASARAYAVIALRG